MLVDTHCHLNFESFDHDRREVLARAWEAGVLQVLNPGIDLPSSREALALADEYSQVYAAVGVHPNSASSWDGSTLGVIRELAQHSKAVAIGEIGLDYYRDRAPAEAQCFVFEKQLRLAAEIGLPVVIHTRNRSEEDQQAIEDVLERLTTWTQELVASGSDLAGRPGVLHSYSSSLEAAQRAIELNFFIGITGPVTFKKADGLREVVRGLPLESLLIETDAPFLTPHPYRGKRNEPAHVQYVAAKIAEIHALPSEKVAEITTANAERLFRWQVIH